MNLHVLAMEGDFVAFLTVVIFVFVLGIYALLSKPKKDDAEPSSVDITLAEGDMDDWGEDDVIEDELPGGMIFEEDDDFVLDSAEDSGENQILTMEPVVEGKTVGEFVQEILQVSDVKSKEPVEFKDAKSIVRLGFEVHEGDRTGSLVIFLVLNPGSCPTVERTILYASIFHIAGTFKARECFIQDVVSKTNFISQAGVGNPLVHIPVDCQLQS